MIGLSRDERHVYYTAYPGEPEQTLPGVTGVLNALAKPAIVKWAQNTVAQAAVLHRGELENWVAVGGVDGAIDLLRKAAETKRDTAASIGSQVHALADALVKGTPVTIPEELAPFVVAYQKWIEDFQPEFLAVEEMIVGDGYGGTFDSIARIADETWLLDIKTGATGPYKDTALQLAAYGNARYIGRPNDPVKYAIPAIDQYGVIRLRPEGAELIPYDVTDAEYAAFMAIKHTYQWERSRGGSVIGQPIGPQLLHFPNPVPVKEKVAV
jgi:hypothetical protein